MESFWGRFKVENGSLFGDAATLGELEWAIGRQMKYHNHGRRHPRLGYRSPMEYLTSEGFVPKTLAEIGPKSGSVPGAHIPSLAEVLSFVTRSRVPKVHRAFAPGDWRSPSAGPPAPSSEGRFWTSSPTIPDPCGRHRVFGPRGLLGFLTERFREGGSVPVLFLKR